MKKILTYISVLLAVCSCSWFDDSKIWEELREHEERIEKLEALCGRLNSNVEALQGIMKALEANDYVTDITRIMEDGVEVGYSITFAKGGTITVYHGADGADASAPKIGIRKASDGEYYWTADDEWMTDEDGEMIPASVAEDPNGKYITPLFRVAEGVWYISYDGGDTWKVVPTGGSEGIFKDVRYDNEYIYFTLADGTELKVAIGGESKVVDLFIFMGQSNMSGFGGDATLAPEVPEGWAYEYKAISNPGGLVPMKEPFGLGEDNAESGVANTKRAGTLVSAFANAYYEKTGVPVVGVSCSRGSTDTEFWKPGGKPLEDAVSRHLAAEEWLKDNGYIVRNNYMVWLQGESDAALSVEQYKSNLIGIVKEMIRKTGITNCMVIRIGKRNPVDNSFDRVLQAQTELPKEYKEFVLASTLAASFPEEGLMSDGVHYSQEGYNLLGKDAGINVAFYAKNGIEPYMYDPHYGSLYYPTGSYRSIFDVPDPDEPQGIVYYELNKNINADDELVDYPGRIAILDYFESNGQAVNVTSSITSTFGIRYYDQDKKINGTYSNYTGSTYSRIVCVLNQTGAALTPNEYDGKTISINGITYLLQQKPEPKSIKVLAIGNSFSVDAMEYLYGMLEDVGYDEIVLGNLYIGGCTLETHASNFTANKGAYTYYHNTTGTWTSKSSYKPLTALDSEDWDYITMQQASPKSGQPETYDPYMTTVIDIVKEHQPDAELVWHMTWAYQGNSTHSGFANYGNDQMTMYNAIVDAVQTKILGSGHYSKVIPSGTAVQNMRTSFVGDKLTRDGYHMSYDKGRYLTALCYAKALTGCDLSQVTYTPSGYTFSSSLIKAMKEAVNNAVAEPFEVSESTFGKDPDEVDYTTATMEEILADSGHNVSDYNKLEIDFTKFAYYNSSNELMKSTLHTAENQNIHNHPNYGRYVGTEILDKYDIPVGSVIIIRPGYKYRPEGWVDLDLPNGTGSGCSGISRPENVRTNVVKVTEKWWGDFNYRAFNLSFATEVALDDATADELISSFAIFVPKDAPGKPESVAFIGNSITAGVGASDKSQRYSTLLAGMLGAREINLGVSGTSLCTGGSRTCNFSKLTAEKLDGAEMVFIKMGINDWAAAKPEFYGLGELGTDDTSTIYGAAAMWCKKIVELKATDQYKDTEFYFITPIVTSWNSSVTSIRDYDQSKTNVHGFTLRELCEAIISTCEVYDIPVLDMNLESGIYYNSPEDDQASKYFGDGVHPNDAGHAKLARSLYTALLKML